MAESAAVIMPFFKEERTKLSRARPKTKSAKKSSHSDSAHERPLRQFLFVASSSSSHVLGERTLGVA
eukprot:7970085-Prorocentrum_lima.AAC.1